MPASSQLMNLIPETESVITELSQVATDIALQNFEWHYVTLVFFNSTLWCGAEVFLKSYKKTVVVGKGTFYPSFADKTRQYVIFGLSVAEILQVLRWMQIHEFDNTGKYIIVCQSRDVNDCEETLAVKTLWDHKVTNVIFLKSVQEEVVGYSYFPLNDSNCKTDLPVKLASIEPSPNKTFRIFQDVFPMKLYDLNNCNLLASSFIQPPYMDIIDGVPSGANGDLLIILAEKLNANLTVMTPRIANGWGKLEEDGTWSGSLADVYYDYANLSMTSAAITLARFSYFHMSIDYNTAGVVWVTHPATKMPSSLKLTRPFQLSTLIAVVVCYLLVVVCALFRGSKLWPHTFHGNITNASRSRSSMVFYSWMIFMGLPSTRLPTKPAYAYLVIQWVWFCFFIRTFYQVSLITVLKANYYFAEFETINDAIEADYAFGGGAALKDYFIDYPEVYNKWSDVETNDIIPMMRNVSEGVQFVLAMSMETAHTIISKEKIIVHILPQKIVTCPTVIFFKKFSPIAKSINGILVKLIESGLSDKIKQIYTSTAKYNRTDNILEPIKIEHYIGCYEVLISGWILSFIFFVGEIFIHKKSKRFCKTK